MASKTEFKWDKASVKKVRKKLEDIRKSWPHHFAAGLMKAGYWVVGSENIRDVPKDLGYLRSTAFVSSPNRKGRKIVVLVGYGAEYAVYVHEMNRNYSNGDWKYLSKPLDKISIRDIGKWVEDAIDKGQKVAAVEKGSVPDTPEAARAKGREILGRVSAD